MSKTLDNIKDEMLDAAKEVLGEQYEELKDYVALELEKLRDTGIALGKLVVSGKLTEERAKQHLELQKMSFKTMLLTAQGVGIATVEKLLNAAVEAVQVSINKLIGVNIF